MSNYPDTGLSSESNDPDPARIRLIVEFWNGLSACEISDAALWESLENIQREVTDCLHVEPPDIRRAESLTAEGMNLMAGCGDL